MSTPVKLSKIDLLNELLKDPDRKSTLKILTEIFSLIIYHKSFPKHYFSRFLFKKNKLNIKDYFPNKFIASLKSFFIDETVIDVVENKLYFDFFYSQFNIKTPKILMYNHKNMFVVGINNFEINNHQDFKIQLQNIFNQNPLFESIFIKKTSWSHGGDKIYKLYKHELNTDTKKVEEIYSEAIRTGFLFQETIKQHPKLDKLNPSCLNTIRLDTFIDNKGKIEIISAFIRMSINNSHVDNASSGGCFVGVDLQNGKLKKEGYRALSTYGVKILTAHPVTNIVFENFKIPLFNQAKELVIRAASLIPGLRLMGWDVAITDSGPFLVEGNSRYNAIGNDQTEGGYRTNEVFRSILRELNIEK